MAGIILRCEGTGGAAPAAKSGAYWPQIFTSLSLAANGGDGGVNPWTEALSHLYDQDQDHILTMYTSQAFSWSGFTDLDNTTVWAFRPTFIRLTRDGLPDRNWGAGGLNFVQDFRIHSSGPTVYESPIAEPESAAQLSDGRYIAYGSYATVGLTENGNRFCTRFNLDGTIDATYGGQDWDTTNTGSPTAGSGIPGFCMQYFGTPYDEQNWVTIFPGNPIGGTMAGEAICQIEQPGAFSITGIMALLPDGSGRDLTNLNPAGHSGPLGTASWLGAQNSGPTHFIYPEGGVYLVGVNFLGGFGVWRIPLPTSTNPSQSFSAFDFTFAGGNSQGFFLPGCNGISGFSSLHQMHRQKDGMYVISGFQPYVNLGPPSGPGYWCITVTRMFPDGFADFSYGTTGGTAQTAVYSHLQDPTTPGINYVSDAPNPCGFFDYDGKLVVGFTTKDDFGTQNSANPFQRFCIARYNKDGSLDTSLGVGTGYPGAGTGFLMPPSLDGDTSNNTQAPFRGFLDNCNRYVWCGHNRVDVGKTFKSGKAAQGVVFRQLHSGTYDGSFGLPIGWVYSSPASVTTNAMTSVGLTTATANATINPNNNANTYWIFMYGISSTPTAGVKLWHYKSGASVLVGSDNTNHTVSVNLTGLSHGQTYFGYAVAWSDTGGWTIGNEVTWTN